MGFSFFTSFFNPFLSKNKKHKDKKYPDINVELLDIDQLRILVSELIKKNFDLGNEINEYQVRLNYLEKLYSDAPFGFLKLLPDGTIVEINKAGCTMLGLNDRSAYGKNFLDYISEEQRKNFYQNSILKYNPEISPAELRMINCPSEPFYVRLVTRPSDDFQTIIIWDITQHRLAEEELAEYQNQLEEMITERTAGLLAINEMLNKEIGERKTAEKSLVQSDKRYRELMDTANSIIIRKGSNGNIIFFNKFAQKFFGYSEEEILGKDVIGTIVPETDSTGRDLGAIIKAIKKNPDQYPVNINENKKKSGERVRISWTNKGIFDDEGNLIEILSIGTDITEQMHIEELLRYNQENAQAILNSPAGPVILLDKTGYILEINDKGASHLNIEKKVLIGKNIFDIYDNKKAENRRIFFNEVISTGKPVHFNDEYNGKYYDVHFYPIHNSTGIVDRITIFSFDITQNKIRENSLHESESRYRQLVESVNSIILRLDPDGNIRYINDYALNFFKYSNDFITGKNIVGTIIPDKDSDGNDLCEMVNNFFKSPEDFPVNENENMLSNGERVWISWTNKAIRDKNNKLVEILCVGNDITRIKNIEKILRESERIYSAMLNAIPERIMLIEPDGKILKINEHAAALIKQSVDELIGKNIFSIYPSDVAEERMNKISQVVKYAQPVKYEVKNHVKIVNTTLYPVLDTKGNVIQIAVYTSDITDQKRTEDELHGIEERFRTTLKHSGMILCNQDISLRYTWIYAPDNFSSVTSFIGKKDDTLFPPNEAALIIAEKNQVINTRKTRQFETVLTIESKQYYFDIYIAPMIDTDSDITGITIALLDISERKKLEQEIVHISETERSHFGEAIHSDLGQYLAAIGFLAQTVKKRCSGMSEDNDRLLSELTSQVSGARKRCRSLAKAFYTAGIEPVTFFKSIHKLCSNIETVYGIKCAIETSSFSVRPDETVYLYSIIQEAVLNSVVHGKADEITMHFISDDTGRRNIIIHDNGVGFTLHENESEGMGMRLMHRKAKTIDAQLKIVSEKNNGTTVAIDLPVTYIQSEGVVQ